MSPVIPVIILALPLFMFIFLGLCGSKMKHPVAGFLGTLGLGVVMVLSYYTAFTYFFSGAPEFISAAGERLQCVMFDQTWLQFTDTLYISLGFFLDPISAMMLVVIAEMIPEASGGRDGVLACVLGYAIMMALDIALG